MEHIILTWKVSKTISGKCPDYVQDEYTGEYPTFHCLVNHFETIVETKSKEFLTREEAIGFAKNAPPSCYDFCLNGEVLLDTRKKNDSFTFADNITLFTDSGTNAFYTN